jgi:hypothetical protein
MSAIAPDQTSNASFTYSYPRKFVQHAYAYPPFMQSSIYRRSDAKQTMKMMGARRSARFACRGWIAGRGVHRVGRTSAVSRLVHLRRFPPSRLLAPSRTRRRHRGVLAAPPLGRLGSPSGSPSRGLLPISFLLHKEIHLSWD